MDDTFTLADLYQKKRGYSSKVEHMDFVIIELHSIGTIESTETISTISHYSNTQI